MQGIDPETVERLLAKEKDFGKRFEGPLQSVWLYVRALWELLKDPRGAWPAKVTAAAALLYVISPIDIIPDFIPIVGFADDAAIVSLAVGLLAGTLPGYIAQVRKQSNAPRCTPLAVYLLPDHETQRSGEFHETNDWKFRFLSRAQYTELGLSCSTGLPVPGEIYALHPYVRNQLVRLADYEEVLVHQKWREYGRVLPILGCAELIVERLDYSDRSGKGEIEAPYADIFEGKVSAGAGKVSVNKSKATDRFQDRGPLSDDAIRRAYRDAVWLLVDNQLSSIVDKRIDDGLIECEREFTTSVDSHINAALAAKVVPQLQKVGFKLSLQYRSVFITKVILRVKFYPFSASVAELAKLREVRVCERNTRLEALKMTAFPA